MIFLTLLLSGPKIYVYFLKSKKKKLTHQNPPKTTLRFFFKFEIQKYYEPYIQHTSFIFGRKLKVKHQINCHDVYFPNLSDRF